MQTNGPVDDATFRDFVAAAALNWTEAERQRITTAYDSLRPELIRLKVPVPERLRLIRTSGREEGEAAYTRADAIILPTWVTTAKTPGILERMRDELSR